MKIFKYLKNHKVIFTIIFPVLFFTGCQDWMDIQPENELIQQEFWKTKSDVLSVVAATYDAVRSTHEENFLMGEVRGDFVYPTLTANDYYYIYKNIIYTTNGAASWAGYYHVINLANTVMYYAPIVQHDYDRTLTQPIVDGITSEMLFLRSLSYFYLVRIWKDVPLVLRPTISDTVDFYIPKSPEYVVLKQIVSDLEKANKLGYDDNKLKGRASKYAIQALLADVLLWKEDYTKSIAYCDSIINTGLFSLEPKADWFKLYYPGNSLKESIFELQYDDRLDNEDNPLYSQSGNKYSNIKAPYDRMGFDELSDIRICGKKGSMWKYLGIDETGENARPSSERDANYIFYRYADVLLIKAEALAEIGNLPEANALLQQVAERAGTFYTPTYSLKEFRAALIAERGREFGAEGKRWFDILRTAKRNHFEDKQFLIDIMLSKASDAKELAVMKSKVIDTMSYYLPISQNEIKNNKKLVQNPFYDR